MSEYTIKYMNIEQDPDLPADYQIVCRTVTPTNPHITTVIDALFQGLRSGGWLGRDASTTCTLANGVNTITINIEPKKEADEYEYYF